MSLKYERTKSISDTDLVVATTDVFFVEGASTAVVMCLLSFVKPTTKNCKDQLKEARLPAL